MNIADIPFPFFMTVSMTTLFFVSTFVVTYIESKSSTSASDRLANSFVCSVKYSALVGLGMAGLFCVLMVGTFISKALWAGYLFVVA
ncbi:hypothetical protein [Pseudoxanthomonas daejeonensis]|uniref:hypothetical protein n=1 Tax=Pseudoxanthomonas daejeonensis TaxID=266062 RepID=UPI00139181D5|nr:hypothetical protein [Pseudoxanthomonas daejeonensis]